MNLSTNYLGMTRREKTKRTKNKYEKRGWKIIDNTYDKINMGFFEIQRLYSSKEFQCISINNTINQLDDDIKTETVDENIQKIDKYI